MTVERAIELAKELNRTGNWFVMRRRKRAELCVAVYVDGKTSVKEF